MVFLALISFKSKFKNCPSSADVVIRFPRVDTSFKNILIKCITLKKALVANFLVLCGLIVAAVVNRRHVIGL
ncbi:hypothetical protein HanIR_Chr12g0596701 [Helianthus annuus]|nr:hypothetical protein HanIR_Chr12g0596701 [Helianthus annuus]